jgi:hypothetical protein
MRRERERERYNLIILLEILDVTTLKVLFLHGCR